MKAFIRVMKALSDSNRVKIWKIMTLKKKIYLDISLNDHI